MHDDDDQTDIDRPEPPIDQPEPEDRRAWRRPAPTVDALKAIIERHRRDYDQRDFDYDLLRPGRKTHSWHLGAFPGLPPGATVAPAYWGQGASAGGRKANYLTLIRDEARQAFGPNAAEAVESLL